jgi:hypothetical protein
MTRFRKFLAKFFNRSAAAKPDDWGGKFKSKWLLVGLILLLLAALYPIVAVLALSPAEIKLAELRRSWEKETICHDRCAGEREKTEDSLIQDLKKESSTKVTTLINKYFVNKSVSPEFKAELVRILARAVGTDNPPRYLLDYAKNTAGDPVVQAAIITVFNPLTFDPDFYFSVLTGPQALSLRLAAVNAISNETDKSKEFSSSQLIILKKLVLSANTENRFRAALVLLLGDYYPLFPTETRLILQDIYQSAPNEDVVSQVFAADLLNRLDQEKLAIPEVSDQAWSEYYNN